MEVAIGAFGTLVTVALTAVITAYVTHRTEHERWLRQERLRAYTTMTAATTHLEHVFDARDDTTIAALDAVELAEGAIEVLGPDRARTAAQRVFLTYVASDCTVESRGTVHSEFLKVATEMLQSK